MKPIRLTPAIQLRPAFGHEYGAGRSTAKHADKRTKRNRTRAEKVRAAKEGWQ